MQKPLSHLNEQTWEAMESCRPCAQDLTDPAMSKLAAEMAANPDLAKMFDRIEQLDVKIGAAFHDVPVPPGLAQRVLDGLANARIENLVSGASNAQGDQTPAGDVAVSLPARVRRMVRRRWILMAGGLLSTAAVVFIALWLNLHNANDYSEQTVLDEAIRFFESDTAGAGFLLADKYPPKNYPFSRKVFISRDIHWRKIQDFLGRPGIAYDLFGRGAQRATLYVIEKNVDELGSAPRLHPFTTGGYSTSAWQEGGLLYVLVIQGEVQTYQKYLSLPRGPVA